MLTNLQIEMGSARFYRFQPRGLNQEDGSPSDACWMVAERFPDGEIIPMPDVPLYIMGSQVRDLASGFAGIATALTMHLNGCIHVTIQPKGKKKNGDMIQPVDFDIRRISGPSLKPMTEKELKKAVNEQPGPIAYRRYTPLAPTA